MGTSEKALFPERKSPSKKDDIFDKEDRGHESTLTLKTQALAPESQALSWHPLLEPFLGKAGLSP